MIRMPTIETWKDNPRTVINRPSTGGTINLQPIERGIPLPLTGVSSSKTSRVVGGSKYVQISLSHKQSSNDPTFHHANVWVTGYLGNSMPQLLSGSTSQSHSLLLPATGDAVSFTLQPVGKDGSFHPLSACPTTSQVLA